MMVVMVIKSAFKLVRSTDAGIASSTALADGDEGSKAAMSGDHSGKKCCPVHKLTLPSCLFVLCFLRISLERERRAN